MTWEGQRSNILLRLVHIHVPFCTMRHTAALHPILGIVRFVGHKVRRVILARIAAVATAAATAAVAFANDDGDQDGYQG